MAEPDTTTPEGTKAATATAAPPAPPKPAPPPKPVAAKPPAKGGKTRRFFLVAMFGTWINVAWVALSASLLGMVLGTVRFLFPNVLSEPPSTFKAGDIGGFEENQVTD